MKILLTGAGGFVGSHILSHLLKNTDHEIICVCSWRHKGEPHRILQDANYQKNKDRVSIITHDLVSPFTPAQLENLKGQNIDIILNIASDSHVDRSITEPVSFVLNNTNLVLNMLELAKGIKPKLFLQFSTDEVYGQAHKGQNHIEWSPIIPSNPYSASKAAQEAIAISYWRTYGVPLIITNTMNVFGEYQDKEKFIPLCIERVKNGQIIQIHGYPDCKTAGSRFYIHARNVADAVLYIMDNVKPKMYPEVDRPERFNVVGEIEIDNLSLAQLIAKLMDKSLSYKLTDFHSARPGHDCRYALDGKKLADAGWKPKVNFEESLKRTIKFALFHR
jgi:dTDP-glucose 4,6-dehydratase